MKKIMMIVLLIATISCTITRKVAIKHVSQAEVEAFYKTKNVNTFLQPKDYNAFAILSQKDKTTIPQNLVFDKNGLEIEHFNKKICSNHTLEFLKTYNDQLELKHTSYTLDEHLKNLKSNDGSLNIEGLIKSRKITIFLNTSTFAEPLKANKEAFEIYNQYKELYQVYLVNYDFFNEYPKN